MQNPVNTQHSTLSKVAIVFYSRFNHTKLLAAAIARGIIEKNCVAQLFSTDEAIQNLEQLSEFDGIIFGSPTYFGCVSAEMKQFFDSTSTLWAKQLWRDKLAGAFTHSGTPIGDKPTTISTIWTFAMQHGMIWAGNAGLTNSVINGRTINRLGSWTGLMAQSEMNQAEPFEADIASAEEFGIRFAQILGRFQKK